MRRSKRRIIGALLVLVAFATLLVGFGKERGWWSDSQADANTAISNTQQNWKQHPVRNDPTHYADGETIGVIRVARFGKDWKYPIVQGASQKQLLRGVAHYAPTELPGQLGNFAVAAHWSGPYAPFDKIQNLIPGDNITVETQNNVFTYRVTKSSKETNVTAHNGSWVLDRVPGKGNEVKPTKHLMTMTSCEHLWRSSDRQVVFAELISSRKKATS